MAAKRLKVLITIDSLNAGGTERQVLELIKGFKGNNHFDLSVLTLTQDGYYDNAVKTHSTLYSLTKKPGDWKRISSFYHLYATLKNNSFDIVHTMSLEDSSIVFVLSKLLNFKWINGSIRDADSRRNRRQLQKRFLLKQSKFVVANSLAGLKVYNVGGNSLKRVIYNGVDRNRFTFSNTESKSRDTEIRLCSVANLSSYKDYFTLIHAVELLRDLPISLHVLGEGPMREILERIVSDKHLQGKITFYGRVSNVEKLLPSMHCGVLMSFKRSGEGLPNAILEFMSSGVPVIASEVGGVSEVVKDNFNGILVEPENPFELSEAIKKIFYNREYLSFLSKNTMSLIQSNFTLEKMIDEYVNFYTEVAHA